LDAEIKFRCELELVARFERIASLERRDKSDLARIVFEDYVAAQERAMKLTLRDRADGPRVPPVPPSQTDTSYLKRKRAKPERAS
jgi:predicted transcriptional regulator